MSTAVGRLRVVKQGELWKVVDQRPHGTNVTLWATHSHPRALEWARKQAEAREAESLRAALRWLAKPWTDLSQDEVPEC